MGIDWTDNRLRKLQDEESSLYVPTGPILLLWWQIDFPSET